MLSALLLFPTLSDAQFRINNGEDSPLRKLQFAEVAISNLYVDSVDEGKLVEDAIRGMLDKLDPHSSYLTPKQVKEANEPLNGNFEGIGVQFNMMDDTLMVIQPVTKGPSEKVGIIAGDRIVSVNDTAIAGVNMSKEEIMKRLRGPKGTKVRLGVVRTGIKDKLLFTVVRDKIPVHSIDATYMIRPGIGYIRIGNFGAQTYDEFIESLNQLKEQGMKDLILDLPDGSMIRLTVSHYYTPSGRCIQKPYTKGAGKDYAMDVMNRLKSGELTNADSVHLADSLKFQTLRKHRTVYGGGGVMPDYYVPLDTTVYTRFHRELAAKGIVIQQNLRFVDNHRKELKKQWTSFDDFKQNYEVPQSLIDDLLAEGKKQKIEPKDEAELEKTIPYLRLQMKSLIARDIWDMSEYFSVFNESSAIVKKALEVIQQ